VEPKASNGRPCADPTVKAQQGLSTCSQTKIDDDDDDDDDANDDGNNDNNDEDAIVRESELKETQREGGLERRQ
jgi:hypothetical protein